MTAFRDLPALGRLLDVAAICKGRIVQRDDTLDIVAELIDADDGSILWRDEYSSQGTSLLGIEARRASRPRAVAVAAVAATAGRPFPGASRKAPQRTRCLTCQDTSRK